MLKFLNTFQLYIMGALLALVLGLSVTVYVQHAKVAQYKAEVKTSVTKLNVSNNSIKELKAALADVEANALKQQEVDKKKQLEVSEALKGAAVKEKELAEIRARLQAVTKVVKPVEVIPGDIKDAWNAL